jgi:hypothetical protein
MQVFSLLSAIGAGAMDAPVDIGLGGSRWMRWRG